jgi:Rrf2 family protein
MKISTKGRYAIRMMIDIAENSNGENISIKDVAERQDISIKYLEQIVSMLCKAGLLKSQRGSQGGYKMTREPKDYTIGDILRVTEGSMAPVACLEDEVNDCPRVNACPTIKFWKGFYKTINDYMDNTTLEDLMNERINSNEELCYFI